MWPGRSAVGADALIYMELPPIARRVRKPEP